MLSLCSLLSSLGERDEEKRENKKGKKGNARGRADCAITYFIRAVLIAQRHARPKPARPQSPGERERERALCTATRYYCAIPIQTAASAHFSGLSEKPRDTELPAWAGLPLLSGRGSVSVASMLKCEGLRREVMMSL